MSVTFDDLAITPREAARAVRVSTATLADLAHRAGLSLDANRDRAAGVHHRYSAADVVALAVAGRLLDAGVKLANIAGIVRCTVDDLMSAVRASGVADLPPAVIRMRLADRVASVAPGAIQGDGPDADVSLCIRVGDIAHDALRRLGR